MQALGYEDARAGRAGCSFSADWAGCSAPTSIRGWQRASWSRSRTPRSPTRTTSSTGPRHALGALVRRRANAARGHLGDQEPGAEPAILQPARQGRHLRPPARARRRASRHRHRAPGCARAPVPDRPYRHVVPGHLRGIAVQARLAPGQGRGPAAREPGGRHAGPGRLGSGGSAAGSVLRLGHHPDRSRLDRAGRASRHLPSLRLRAAARP